MLMSSLVFSEGGPDKDDIKINWSDKEGHERTPSSYASVYEWKSKMVFLDYRDMN